MTLVGAKMIFIISVYLFCLSASLAQVHEIVCPCDNKKDCVPVSDWNPDKREVIVVADKSKDYALWKHDAYTSVIEWNDYGNDDVMCFTHSQGKKYGIYLDTIPVKYNSSDDKVKTFINVTRKDIAMQHADMLALGLLDLLGDCDNAGHHVEGIIEVTTAVVTGIKLGTTTKVLCVMPWMPPCFNANCGISPSLAKVCDGLILTPESYNTYCDQSCTAKATMGYGKIIFGITEYLASGWNESQVLLGIPWHGYNYTCDHADIIQGSMKSSYSLCHLKQTKVGNTTTCNFDSSRTRISIGTKEPAPEGGKEELALMDGNFSRADWSPWKMDIVKDKKNTTTYMTWYEDIGSLMKKYGVVHELNLRGSVIFTADDLTYTDITATKQFNDNMWAWMLHSILASAVPQKRDASLNVSGMMAGLGVGMFILGCLLGAIFSCIIFRRKKNLHPPFSRDTLADEFRDDDDHNQL